MFCTNCGARQNDDAKFCTNCGATLTPLEPVKPAPAPAPNDAGRVEGGSASSGERAQRQQSMPQKKRGGVGRVVAIVVILLALAGVGAGAFLTKGFGLLGVIPKGSVNDYSWSELSRISEEIAACESDEAALQVAQSYNLVDVNGQLDGTQAKRFELTDGTPAEAVIIGFRHDDRTDGGKAGITFMLMDCVSTHVMNADRTNAGGWEQSEMRSYVNTELASLLPNDLREQIVSVKKLTDNVGRTDSLDSVTVTSDIMWLLSNSEVVGSMMPEDFDESTRYVVDINNAEGAQYQLFRTINVDRLGTTEALRKSIDGSPVTWWLRSPYPSSEEGFMAIGSTGKARSGGNSDNVFGVAPGFCL